MEYIVSASELYQKAKEIVNAGMEYVEISFMEPDGDLPAAVHFNAFKKDGFSSEDFEEIDVVTPGD